MPQPSEYAYKRTVGITRLSVSTPQNVPHRGNVFQIAVHQLVELQAFLIGRRRCNETIVFLRNGFELISHVYGAESCLKLHIGCHRADIRSADQLDIVFEEILNPFIGDQKRPRFKWACAGDLHRINQNSPTL